MEYALFVSEIRELPADPRSLCAGDWQGLLPPAPLRAVYFGSEFCADLLPDPASLERLCLWARAARLEPVWLTPVVTSAGVTRVDRLLQGLVDRDLAPAVVFNDWGVLNLLRRRYPGFGRRAGRLLNRAQRDPRLPGPSGATCGQSREPGGLRSLLVRFGVEAVETDPDPEGSYLGGPASGMQRVLHFPFVAAATGRNCLIKADGAESAQECFTKGLGLPCASLCRGRCHAVARTDCALPLWRAGNTVFYQLPRDAAQAQLARADRVVLYERPTA